MQNDVRVWVDGRRLAADEPAISVLDHGVTVGDGAFETCKVIDGKAFALTRHMRRLDRSLAGLGLASADHERIGEGVRSVLDGEPIAFGRLRYSITAGAGPLGSDRLESPLTYIVTAARQPTPAPSVKVVVVPWTRNERSATAGLKTTSYADNVVALAYAAHRGGSEAIFANTRGELCEATGSNVFVVRDGVVLTPPLESGCLAGITRELTLQWCRAAGMEVSEQPLPLEAITTSDEVFLTSSTKDVMAVHAVDDVPMAPGPVTAAAAELFAVRGAESMDP
jgi:branched-chain amino acid aminotransferase